ncbi:outer membrane beta-barrel protein [Helicobacter cetorum]|uniref:Outer membrane protein HomB n=1 Tax=Helicobacter cetorum (strain ATCC BAA-429 / MIT 00-7128) TaxID=182217 RepID=I0ELA9_HELC0|nr:outer membrane beta-barrel protein [Helicobacter cetorum]AFI03728.1 hypothetical protein HCW_02225 [Helicobacter cetorum MIT 00-7128]
MNNDKSLTMNVKTLSKSACLVLASFLSECEAHPKSGFFVEGGFETGELQARQREKTRVLNNSYMPPIITSPSFPQNASKPENKPSVIEKPQEEKPQIDESQVEKPQQVVLKYPTLKSGADIKQLEQNIKAIDTTNSQDLFTKDNITDPSRSISTTAPIKITLANKEGKVSIQNYLPYDLSNVDVVVKYLPEGATDNSQMKEVKIATIAKLGADKEVLLDPKDFPNLKDYFDGDIDPQDFKIKPKEGDTSNTARVLNAVNSITTNIHGHFSNQEVYYSVCGKDTITGEKNPCFTDVSVTDAKNYFNTFLSIAYVIDSKEWEDMVRNAPFKFWDRRTGIIDPQTVIDRFRADTNDMTLKVLSPRANNGKLKGRASNGGGLLAVQSEFLDFSKLDLLKNNKYCQNNGSDLDRGHCLEQYGNASIVLHEFSHTKGYGLSDHKGNMTKHYSDSFVGLTLNAWIELGAKGDLPIYYENGKIASYDEGKVPKHSPGTRPIYYDCWGINVDDKNNCQPKNTPNASVIAQKEQDLQHAHARVMSNRHYLQLPNKDTTTTFAESSINASLSSMFSEHLSNTFIALSNQVNNNDNQTSTKEQTLKAPMLGFNAMLGYQQYFNDYVGLSYYGFFNYNNANLKGTLKQVSQLGLGVGSNLLLDFYTSYDNNSVRNVLGIFGGFRALWSNYKSNGLIKLNKNLGNIHFTTGINYRYKHSKFSIGIALPLLKQNINAKSVQDTTISEVELSETPKNMHIYFNYGWVF